MSKEIAKKLSENDVKRGIISLQKGAIKDALISEDSKIKVLINGKKDNLNFNKDRTFISGVTNYFNEIGINNKDYRGEANIRYKYNKKEEMLEVEIEYRPKGNLIEKIKERYNELINDKGYIKDKEIDLRERNDFLKLFPLENLDKIKLENWDYKKDLDESKYKNSVMYFVTYITNGHSLARNDLKLFYYDGSNNLFNATDKVKNKFSGNSIEEKFTNFISDLSKYLKNIDFNNYDNKYRTLHNSNVIQSRLVNFYYPDKIFSFSKQDIFDIMFRYLNVKIPKDIDTVEKSLRLQRELEKKDSFFKDIDIHRLSSAIYDVCENNDKKLQKIDINNHQFQSASIDIPLNKILYGVPGTGKTYGIINECLKIIDEKNYRALISDSSKREEAVVEYNRLLKEGRIKFCTFHHSYSYEEFVEGLRYDEKGKIVIKDGILKEVCKKIEYDKNDCIEDSNCNNYVLVIDEINRGDISKIFGELITIIEDDKRIGASLPMTVTLPYSRKDFGIPRNLYILGTMNSADKSISIMDFALRRRFKFEEILPNYELLNENLDGINLKELLEHINDRIEYLLDSEHKIGHAYFMKRDLDLEGVKKIIINQIIPLLREYFFDDWEKIALVLGGSTDKDDNSKFIIRKLVKFGELFNTNGGNEQDSKYKYQVNYNANIEAIKNIWIKNEK